ncbi:MAG: galactokinase [candidate division KSB1 bacterium]|nr:galactokinase [candidate division KSB1 bacterium]MDZ7340034.1 galactokinase [candidate division KSB1 bacterium]
MLNLSTTKSFLNDPQTKERFVSLYGNEDALLQQQIVRYQKILSSYQHHFPDQSVALFSTPGRTELSGNHTDHNAGRVIAAAIHLDSIAVAAKTDNHRITIISEGFATPFQVDLNDALAPKPELAGTTTALIRGIVSRLHELGYHAGGFNAYISSQVKVGSGLSSSASVEILIGTILNHFYNQQQIPPETLALVGQFAENVHFQKPCGLMDQITCAVGGIVSIDFREPQQPAIQKIDFDFNRQDYSLVIVDTGGSHANLVDDYASIPSEMKAVAALLGGKVCRDIDLTRLLAEVKALRPKVGDRAVLRALHFLLENERVQQQVRALQHDDFETFLHLVNESGNSSFKWLQNSYTIKDVREQGISLGLAMTDYFLNELGRGACRVHGGGFSGTIQAYLPKGALADYITFMEKIFGEGCVLKLNIRRQGTTSITKNL